MRYPCGNAPIQPVTAASEFSKRRTRFSRPVGIVLHIDRFRRTTQLGTVDGDLLRQTGRNEFAPQRFCPRRDGTLSDSRVGGSGKQNFGGGRGCTLGPCSGRFRERTRLVILWAGVGNAVSRCLTARRAAVGFLSLRRPSIPRSRPGRSESLENDWLPRGNTLCERPHLGGNSCATARLRQPQ